MPPIGWRTQAQEDWLSILTYVQGQIPAGARTLQHLLDGSLTRLRRYPELHREGRVDGTREALFHPNYFYVYRVTPGHIEILRVLHARRRYP